MSNLTLNLSRRKLLSMIGYAAGGSVMYQAMTSLGFAAESSYKGPVRLQGDPKGATVLVLGAGLAGMAAALELRDAGYKVKVLEYQNRPGGRNISIYGGDEYTELGGEKQVCQFDKGLYLNPGPWRIPYHHHAVLDYCKKLNVKLEPFIQMNFNAMLHSQHGFDGKPQRYRDVFTDYRGGLSELMSKAVNSDKLDLDVTGEDKEKLLESLQAFGVLDKEYKYVKGLQTSSYRGYKKPPGGGLTAIPEPSDPISFKDLISSQIWANMNTHFLEEFQQTMFQPVGGMGMIGKAFGKEVGELIRYNAHVTEIKQNDKGVTVTYVDREKGGDAIKEEADWCVCTIPLAVLSQIPMNVGSKMQDAINNVPYAPAVKVGGQFKRRFWEEDERIYGGISYTDLPITQISYPSTDYFSSGKGVLLNAYMFGPTAVEFTAMPPKERIAKAIELGAQIHPQIKEEYENGFTVAWNRMPWILGCYGIWTDATRKEHYKNLCEIDGRIVLAGEHASYIPAWMEGALESSIDAITRLHKKVLGSQS